MIIAIKYYTLVSGQDWAREFVTFGLFRLFHVQRQELVRDISRSPLVLSATIYILIYSRNNLLFVLAYLGIELPHPRPIRSYAKWTD